MNRTILALLFSVALTGASGAAQACGGYTFNASAEAVAEFQNNPVLPPVAEQTNHDHHSAAAAASGTPDSRGDVRGTALNHAVSWIASWKDKFKTMFDPRIVAQNCLATAVYFEARSESQLGQLAVATVILNRVKVSNYSSSICGVVYQGARNLNACQFSFACDGKPDLLDDARAWETALAVTALALVDDKKAKNGRMQVVATATHYHADYVEPNWSKSLYRLTKIGHHIFYSQG